MSKVIVLLLHNGLKLYKKIFTDADPVLGTCNIQVLLATDFNNVPHDTATWNDLRGAARTVFRSCIRGKRMGGLVTRNGTLLASVIHTDI